MATKINQVKNVRVECDVPNYILRYNPYHYGSNEYWSYLSGKLNAWVKEFHEFIRDHRSQDPVSLSPVFDAEDVCSDCGDRWDASVWDDEGQDGLLHCNCCGAVVESASLKE